jgi:hypothetical protein
MWGRGGDQKAKQPNDRGGESPNPLIPGTWVIMSRIKKSFYRAMWRLILEPRRERR